MLRRSFLKNVGVISFGSTLHPSLASGSLPASPEDGVVQRTFWIQTLARIARPVLSRLAEERLKATMPVEQVGRDRELYSHLEAFGRTLAGLAPWLELDTVPQAERSIHAEFVDWTIRGLSHAVNPSSPDYLNFIRGGQPLVDAAFLAHAVVRAPRLFTENLDAETRTRLITALRSTRAIVPVYSNWLLFSAMVEAALYVLDGEYDAFRVDLPLRKFSEWYVGDGCYSDGSDYHWDYYNSYVIQPFLLDLLTLFKEGNDRYGVLYQKQILISQRYGEILERLINPDGTFPPIGRSIAYRSGAFQLLAQLALRNQLPESLKTGQVRNGLTAVIRKTMESGSTFDSEGWLKLGLYGSQPGLAEGYVSTGSLYLCSMVFLPLGLPADHPFWTSPGAEWTSRRIWSGEDRPADHALEASQLRVLEK